MEVGQFYKVAYKFEGQIVFIVEFRGERDMPIEELERILREQAAIMRGERVGVKMEWLGEGEDAEVLIMGKG